ncbi:MAG TPA: hypothetical protein PKM73_09865 [Verrucomicrobiota bacterium]|nr:hypothetical protein [Verrucomicrobiota bacterium]
MVAFRKAAELDLAVDPHGNRYLPILMGPEGRQQLPQRGQWAFLHAVYPGQLFARDDPLVQGNLAMLEATERQGMVTELNGIATPFGPLHLHVEADKDGRQLTVSVKPLDANCKAVVVHLPIGGTKPMHPQQGGRISVPLR